MLKGEIVLFIGGARSGKSSLAEDYASLMGNDVIYIATAGVHDEEMSRRVRLHRERRSKAWKTIEETSDVPAVLASLPRGSIVLVDCITIWISNLLHDQSNLTNRLQNSLDIENRILKETDWLIQTAVEMKHKLILVSNEVGYGIVPNNELGRLFRDTAGRVNQLLARRATKVIWSVAGIPVEIKSPATNNAREGI